MKSTREGYQYKLRDEEGTSSQIIQFIERGPNLNIPGEKKTLLNGTTSWELIKVLFDHSVLYPLRRLGRWFFNLFGGR